MRECCFNHDWLLCFILTSNTCLYKNANLSTIIFKRFFKSRERIPKNETSYKWSMFSVDGTFTSWTAWTQCTATCNGGIQQHQRVCTYSPTAPHGKPCIGNTSEVRDCGLNECPGTLNREIYPMYLIWKGIHVLSGKQLYCLHFAYFPMRPTLKGKNLLSREQILSFKIRPQVGRVTLYRADMKKAKRCFPSKISGNMEIYP